MHPPKYLSDLQSWFTQAIATESSAGASQWVRPSESMTPSERIDAYMNDFWPRCIDSLSEDFPKTAAALGESWPTVCRAYITHHPSTQFTLFYLGLQFPQFLRNHGYAPLICELSELECAILVAEISHAESLDSLDANTALQLQPHCSLLTLSFDFDQLPRLIDAPKAWAIVYQNDCDAAVELIDRIQFQFLARFLSPTSLSAAYDELEAHLSDGEMDWAADQIHDWMSLAVGKNWLKKTTI